MPSSIDKDLLEFVRSIRIGMFGNFSDCLKENTATCQAVKNILFTFPMTEIQFRQLFHK